MILLKPKFLLKGEDLTLLRDVYIGIEDRKIVYIGKEKTNDFEELIELPNDLIMPSFINAHTHVAMTILRGLKDDVNLETWLMKYILPVEKLLKPKDVYYGALYGIAEMIRTGTSLFLDMYYHEIEVARAAVDTGIRAMLSYGSADLFFNRDAEEEFKIALKFIGNVETLRNTTNTTDRIFYALGPHSVYGCSKDLLTLFRDYSRENNLRIHIHLSETKNEYNMCKKSCKKTPIEYLYELNFLSDNVMAAHVVWTNEKDLDILHKTGTHVLHNPTSNLKLASGIANIPQMLEKGINVALATDGPASNNRLDSWKEMHIAALIHKGYTLNPTVLPAKTVLKMATINGAKALGVEKFLGSLDIGKHADFVVVNLKKMLESTPIHDIYSMIVYALDSRAIESVWIAGREIYSEKDGFKTIDIDNLREKIETIRQRLIEEAQIDKH